MKIIMFTGHRDCICDVVMLENIAALYDDCTWIHGGAVGFDQQVAIVAAQHKIETKVYKPNYKEYSFKTAPIIRNKCMLSDCDMVIACYDGRKSGGTYFVICEAKKAGKKVIILSAHRHIPTQRE